MAMVYKSENYYTIYDCDNELGPGEYIDKHPKPELRQNQEPFLSSSNRMPIHENEVPGPGTYYKDFQKLKMVISFLLEEKIFIPSMNIYNKIKPYLTESESSI